MLDKVIAAVKKKVSKNAAFKTFKKNLLVFSALMSFGAVLSVIYMISPGLYRKIFKYQLH